MDVDKKRRNTAKAPPASPVTVEREQQKIGDISGDVSLLPDKEGSICRKVEHRLISSLI